MRASSGTHPLASVRACGRPVPVGAVPATDNVPPDTVVPPEYELAPVKITVPEFRTRTAPEPAIVPKKVPVLG